MRRCPETIEVDNIDPNDLSVNPASKDFSMQILQPG
jgi:hypothetical protein